MSDDFEREERLRQVKGKAYQFVLGMLDDMSEPERRYFLLDIGCHLINGAQLSIRVDLMHADLERADQQPSKPAPLQLDSKPDQS